MINTGIELAGKIYIIDEENDLELQKMEPKNEDIFGRSGNHVNLVAAQFIRQLSDIDYNNLVTALSENLLEKQMEQ